MGPVGVAMREATQGLPEHDTTPGVRLEVAIYTPEGWQWLWNHTRLTRAICALERDIAWHLSDPGLIAYQRDTIRALARLRDELEHTLEYDIEHGLAREG